MRSLKTKNTKIIFVLIVLGIIYVIGNSGIVDESLMVNELCMMGSSIISDEKLKKNISQCPTGSTSILFNKVKALKTYEYQFKTEDSNSAKRRGFIAQRVDEQFPEIVKKNYRRAHPVRKNSSDQWIDEDGNIVDTGTYTIVIDDEHPDMGYFVGKLFQVEEHRVRIKK